MYCMENQIDSKSNTLQDQHIEGLPDFVHIQQNEFLHRKHKKQKEEDIATCDCKYDFSNPDSACGDRCLNLLTSVECTPDYCPCGSYCRNQRFQKCENAESKLFKTEGRGWGLMADENIKAGQFIIEYCGEVISCKEARRRSHAYEHQGLLDAYIILLDSHESIDATKKGSLARFINHSCQPNCETRKWTVLGEVRVGIFAKQDIPIGTELAYNYNFEWYGGAKVRCLCGEFCCSGFLGAKSRGFQEDTYLWDDDDDRYSVENIPTYDSAEDEPTSKLLKTIDSPILVPNINEKYDSSIRMGEDAELKQPLESNALVIEPFNYAGPMEVVVMHEAKTEVNEDTKLCMQNTDQNNAMVSHNGSNNVYRDYYVQTRSLASKKLMTYGGKWKRNARKEVDAKRFLASKEAQEEVYHYEEMKKHATSQLDSVYDEIRPAIEEHERDNQDNVSTNVAERWIEATCTKIKADFDLYSSIIKQVANNSRKPGGETDSAKGDTVNGVKMLTN